MAGVVTSNNPLTFTSSGIDFSEESKFIIIPSCIKLSVNGVLTLSSDHNTIGTYSKTVLTITGNNTDNEIITAVTGNLDVSAGVDVTGTITCSTDLDIEGNILGTVYVSIMQN